MRALPGKVEQTGDAQQGVRMIGLQLYHPLEEGERIGQLEMILMSLRNEHQQRDVIRGSGARDLQGVQIHGRRKAQRADQSSPANC